MRLNVIFREENETIKLKNTTQTERINVGFEETSDRISVAFAEAQRTSGKDYNDLYNKPMINSVVLTGSITADELGLGRVYYDTKSAWDSKPETIAEKSTIYIYSDYTYIEDEVGNRTEIAGLKIGDGSSYLIDMPFVSDATTYMIVTHVADSSRHISAGEREFWNNKVSAFINPESVGDELVLSKTQYELNGKIIDYQ